MQGLQTDEDGDRTLPDGSCPISIDEDEDGTLSLDPVLLHVDIRPSKRASPALGALTVGATERFPVIQWQLLD